MAHGQSWPAARMVAVGLSPLSQGHHSDWGAVVTQGGPGKEAPHHDPSSDSSFSPPPPPPSFISSLPPSPYDIGHFPSIGAKPRNFWKDLRRCWSEEACSHCNSSLVSIGVHGSSTVSIGARLLLDLRRHVAPPCPSPMCGSSSSSTSARNSS
uniref:Uncharacterized protein n=1 Tax=Oryza sativa subsp. japonica TaxID=39947 RepID=Q6YWK9_ORYSJ|nr:hypothetical protein [Oryza sativa Japonica Group]BAD10622.1 hypothetical protein [Oryza sativa Japonica Group]